MSLSDSYHVPSWGSVSGPMFLLGGLCLGDTTRMGTTLWWWAGRTHPTGMLVCSIIVIVVDGSLALMIRNTSLEIRVISSVTQHQIQRPGKEGQETWNLCGRLWWPSFYDLFVQGWGTWPSWHPPGSAAETLCGTLLVYLHNHTSNKIVFLHAYNDRQISSKIHAFLPACFKFLHFCYQRVLTTLVCFCDGTLHWKQQDISTKGWFAYWSRKSRKRWLSEIMESWSWNWLT